jgi:Holliday junction resolvasome RuvABC ATP-dependent DNA helicase subunit
LRRPAVVSIDLGPEVRARIEPHIFDALFDYVREHRSGSEALSITSAKEILALALPRYRELIAEAVPPGIAEPLPAREVGVALHDWLHAASVHFRREGARDFREAVALAEPARTERLWGSLFSGRLLPRLLAEGVLREPVDPQRLEISDILVESVRLWVHDVAARMGRDPEVAAASFFLDAEAELEANITWRGQVLRLRGRPDALLIDRGAGHVEVVEYKFGAQGQLELQIAQTLLYLALINAVKGPGIEHARLQLFRMEVEAPVSKEAAPQSEFHPAADAAFDGYVGNHAAVRRLKIECTLALREGQPPRMPINWMFCGPGGLGKTELARRVAKALGLPLVDIPARNVKNVDELLERVDATLDAAGRKFEEAGTESGFPRRKYPPLVIFLDEIHEMGKKADAFLNFFEPREKRAVGKSVIGDFKDATILGATTDVGKLPAPFLTRFRQIDLSPYSADEVATIVRPTLTNTGAKPDDAVALQLARMSRLNPRVALDRAAEVVRMNQFNARQYPLSAEGLRRVSGEMWNVDDDGLRASDHQYLRALASGRKGISALTSLLPVGKEEIEKVIEPYLLQLELIRKTEGGRELTELGRLKVQPSAARP